MNSMITITQLTKHDYLQSISVVIAKNVIASFHQLSCWMTQAVAPGPAPFADPVNFVPLPKIFQGGFQALIPISSEEVAPSERHTAH